MGKPGSRMDLDVANLFEQKAEEQGWKRVHSTGDGLDILRNYAGDELIKHHSYAADAEIRYELKISDALAIAPDGRSGTTAHAMGVLDEIRDYMSKAELEVRRKRTAEKNKEAAGDNHG